MFRYMTYFSQNNVSRATEIKMEIRKKKDVLKASIIKSFQIIQLTWKRINLNDQRQDLDYIKMGNYN